MESVEHAHEPTQTAKVPPGQQAAGELEDPGLEALRVIRHDFKTPLTSLKMLGQIFQIGLEQGTLVSQPERAARNCKMLIEQVDRLVALADSLYEISVVQSGRLRLERQLSDLRPVLQNAVSRHGDRIAGCVLPEEPVWGEWDTARLLQAFSHLLSEGEGIAINAHADAKEGQVVVDFSGAFQPLGEKISPSRYLARVIIEKHGGQLTDRYQIRLPLAPTTSR